jgi:hypothetical protein
VHSGAGDSADFVDFTESVVLRQLGLGEVAFMWR